ncbi:MAG: hypothetical protein ACXAAM_02275 [Candidatus Heimdallarchaeaceae archaeon]
MMEYEINQMLDKKIRELSKELSRLKRARRARRAKARSEYSIRYDPTYG